MRDAQHRRLIVVALLGCLGCVGCASTSVESTLETSVQVQLHRIYVVVDNKTMPPKGRDKLEQALTSELTTLLAERDIDVETRVLPAPDPLALEDPELISREDIEAFKPDGILLIEAVSGEAATYGLKNMDYQAGLFVGGSKKPAWICRIKHEDFGNVLQGSDMMGEKTAQALISKLSEDGLIP